MRRDALRNVTTEGAVAQVLDRGLGRKVLVVNGPVPAANYARVPKVGRPALGLAGGFAYAQVKLDPDRVFAVHVDVLCADPAHPSRSESAAGTASGDARHHREQPVQEGPRQEGRLR